MTKGVQIIFPEKIEILLHKIAKEYGLDLARDTHYDAINRVLSWIKGSIRRRIDFTLIENGSIAVTLYKDIFPSWPKLWIWFHNVIPGFPYKARIEWMRLGELPEGETDGYYYERIKSYIELALKDSEV